MFIRTSSTDVNVTDIHGQLECSLGKIRKNYIKHICKVPGILLNLVIYFIGDPSKRVCNGGAVRS